VGEIGMDEAVGHQPVVLAMAVNRRRPQDQPVGELAVAEGQPRDQAGDGDQQQGYRSLHGQAAR